MKGAPHRSRCILAAYGIWVQIPLLLVSSAKCSSLGPHWQATTAWVQELQPLAWAIPCVQVNVCSPPCMGGRQLGNSFTQDGIQTWEGIRLLSGGLEISDRK